MDRLIGHGVMPKEFYLLKLKLENPYPISLKDLEDKEILFLVPIPQDDEPSTCVHAFEELPNVKYCLIDHISEFGIYQLKNGEIVICDEINAISNFRFSFSDLILIRFVLSKLW